MPIAQSLKIQTMSQASDPKQAVLDAVGDLDKVEVFSGWILLGTYIRPEKSRKMRIRARLA
jgi:hypothetical protein